MMKYSRELRWAHDRTMYQVKKLWGKASDWQCVLCFDTARYWAWLWRTHDVTDVEGFVPMCLRDHRDYDYDMWITSRQSPESRARSSRAKKKQWQDPRYKAKVIEGLRNSTIPCAGCGIPRSKFNPRCPICIRRKRNRERQK